MREKIGKRLRTERERLGLSLADFAAKGDSSTRSQSVWEAGEAVPNAGFLAALDGHGVDVLYVVTGRHCADVLGDDESAMLTAFRGLDERGKDLIFGMLAAMDLGTSDAPPQFGRAMRLLKTFRRATDAQKAEMEALAARIDQSGKDGA